MVKEKKLSFVIASDHTDRNNAILKEIKNFLEYHGYKCEIYDKDCGPNDDFPIIASGAVEKICSGAFDRAILIGGTGSGMAMVANKFKGVYATVVNNFKELVEIVKRDDPNVLCIPAWNFPRQDARQMIRLWLHTKPSNDEKYVRRRKEIKAIEEKNFK